MIMLGWDNELQQACIYKIDPAGYYRQMFGCSIGVKQQQATTILEKKIKKNKQLTYDETVEVCARAHLPQIVVECRAQFTHYNKRWAQICVQLILRCAWSVHRTRSLRE
jgi:hypothetical protein